MISASSSTACWFPGHCLKGSVTTQRKKESPSTSRTIDAQLEVNRYRDEVLAKAGAQLDAQGKAMLEEDLRSPCTEEIAVFRAFARTVDKARGAFGILDTAPTGHTILLMDSAEAYHHEVMPTHGDMPEAVRQLLPRLRDPISRAYLS
jgi:arsenite-transporting ATPase